MSALDDRLRRGAQAVHDRVADLAIPGAELVGIEDARRRRPSSRQVSLVAAAVVVLVVASAVALVVRGDGSNRRPFTVAALAKGLAQGSARIEASFHVPAAHGDFGYTGVVDFAKGDGRLYVVDSTTPDGPKQRVLQELVVDGRGYVPLDRYGGEVPADIRRTKRWVENDRASGSLLQGLGPFDPSAPFLGAHVAFTDLGETHIRGSAVEQYRGTSHTTVTAPGSSTPMAITTRYDVYVDHQSRIVRVSSRSLQSVGVVTSRIDFSDFGVRVEVSAPPADQVVRQSELPPFPSP